MVIYDHALLFISQRYYIQLECNFKFVDETFNSLL